MGNAVALRNNLMVFEYRISNKEPQNYEGGASTFFVRYSAVQENLLKSTVLLLNPSLQGEEMGFFTSLSNLRYKKSNSKNGVYDMIFNERNLFACIISHSIAQGFLIA